MKKHTTKALITSLLSMLLCVSMLIGSTFAWFTDTATTGVNTIVSGNLDVDLVDAEGNTLVGKTLDFVKAEGHEDEEILWEPGCTYALPEIFVKNNGNLALKYEIIITGVDGDAKLNEAIEWTFEGIDNGQLLKGETSSKIVIKGHMKEEAGNEYKGLTMDGISITVVATQLAAEFDSFNNTYDENATYYRTDADGKIIIDSAAGLMTWARDVNAKKDGVFGKDVEITENIDLTGFAWNPVNLWAPEDGLDFTINGNGKTITGMTIAPDDTTQTGFIAQKTGKLTIKDLTFANAVIENCKSLTGVVIGYNYGDTTLNNVDVVGASVKGRPNLADIRIGGLIGFVPSDAAGVITIDANCEVKDSDFYGYHNVAGLVGSLHIASGFDIQGKVTGCTFTLCTTSASATKYTNALYVDAGFTRPYTLDQGNNEFFFAVKAEDQAALNEALTKEDVKVVNLPAGEYTLLGKNDNSPNMVGKEITFTGTKDTVMDLTGIVGATWHTQDTDAVIIFDGVTVKWGEDNEGYQGFTNAEKVVYNNCTIYGTQFMGGDADFIDCVFEAENTAEKGYAVYGRGAGTLTFTDCTFNTDGRALMLFQDQTTEVKVVMTNCTFKDNGNYDSKFKAVVETGDGSNKTSKFDITLTNCTAEGFEANNSTSSLWGNKDNIPADRLTVTIDGVKVY